MPYRDGFESHQFNQFVEDMREAYEDFDDWLKQFLLQRAYSVINRAKRRTPVDTGFLRLSYYVGDSSYIGETGIVQRASIDSVRVIGNQLYVEVGNGAEYASFQEFGTYDNRSATPPGSSEGKGIQGKFMMTISINEVIRTMPKEFHKQFRKYLQSKGVAD